MPSLSLVRPLFAASALLVLAPLGGCSDDGGEDSNTASTGGTNAATGGAATGGAASGGADPGGTGGATGGAATGGTGDDGSGGEGSGGDGSGGDTGGDEFTLTSTALTDMGAFPDENTCAGGMGLQGFGLAIPLEWSGFPEGTQSFALTMIDVTLVDGQDNYLGCHSAFWNVPVTTTSMPAGNWQTALEGAPNIRNGYLGPCPNFGGGSNVDTYEFTLYAMGDATLSDPAINANAFSTLADCNAFRDALENAALAKVTLTGTSDASN